MYFILSVMLFASIFMACEAGDTTHVYSDGEKINLWVNSIGPYHNPTETYPYYKLPFCNPTQGVLGSRKKATLGEILEGNELRNSGYQFNFGTNVEKTHLCSQTLNNHDTKEFKSAIEQLYWYQMYLDDLPMWGMVGLTKSKHDYAIFTHRRFDIAKNGNQIIEVNLTSENPQPLVEGNTLEFTYSVHWQDTERSFEQRFDRYLEYDFFENHIHWFSIFNSFMMVIFLSGLVALILVRALKKDIDKYRDKDFDSVHDKGHDIEESSSGVLVASLTEHSGWKQVRGDVFRSPHHLVWLSAFVGIGWQLAFLVLGLILFTLAGPLHGDVYEQRGEFATSFLVFYSLSCAVSGYASGSFYMKYQLASPLTASKRKQQKMGKNSSSSPSSHEWQFVLLLSIVFLPGIVTLIYSFLLSLSIYYDTINAIPASSLLYVLIIWFCVSVPLHLIGTLVGRHMKHREQKAAQGTTITGSNSSLLGMNGHGGKQQGSTRTVRSSKIRVNEVPRSIPTPTAWHQQPLLIVPLAGLLPFGSIFIEMYFIYASFWNYKFYYVFGFMFLIFSILLLVTILTAITVTYMLLNAENYHWQWHSFMSGASTGFYVLLYSVYFLVTKTQMSGLLQLSYYAGYSFLFSFIIFFMCGAVGLFGATQFVQYIYENIKLD